jgi:hypothetical protein
MMTTKPDISKVFRTVFLMLVLATFSTALSASNAEWSEPVNLTDWTDELRAIHHLGMSDDGRQVAFWMRFKPNKQWSIWARVLPSGGDWEPAHNVSGWTEEIGEPPGTYIYDFAMTPGGEAWAIWAEQVSQQPGDNIWLKGARCSPEECTWQVENISDGLEGFIYDMDLSIELEGHLAVSWVACAQDPSYGGPCAVNVKRRFPGAVGWEPLNHLDGSSGMAIYSVDTLVGTGGLTYVQWEERSPVDAAKSGLFGRTYLPALDTWDGSNSTPLSGWKEGLSPSEPVMDPSGTVITAWSELISKSPNTYSNYSRTRSATSGTWSTSVKISQDSETASWTRLAAGQNGTVLAVTVKDKPGSTSDYGVFATVRDAGSTWGPETQLSDWFSRGSTYPPTYPTFGVWPDGTCLVTWDALYTYRDSNLDEAIFWNSRPPNSSWSGKGRLSLWYSSVDYPNLGLGNDGSAVLTWTTKDAYQPANQQMAIMVTHFPPGGPWTEPIALSDWDYYSAMYSTDLAVHPEGQPVGALWYQAQSTDSAALFYSQFSAEEEVERDKVYLPMVAIRGEEIR